MHRRTYIASKPGRIISALRNAGSLSPLVLMDEIDKLDTSRGSPSSALLEVLDPEQNRAFVDRYLELDVDLSNVLWVATANEKDTIPGPLQDRMEFIHFREYTLEERQKILSNYILPKVTTDYKIDTLPIEWADETLEDLATIKQVRQIEQKVRRLLRVAATNIYAYEHSKQTINKEFAQSILKDQSPKKNLIGFCREEL